MGVEQSKAVKEIHGDKSLKSCYFYLQDHSTEVLHYDHWSVHVSTG